MVGATCWTKQLRVYPAVGLLSATALMILCELKCPILRLRSFQSIQVKNLHLFSESKNWALTPGSFGLGTPISQGGIRYWQGKLQQEGEWVKGKDEQHEREGSLMIDHFLHFF
ncbi:hypothetical protein ACJX0J_005399, partial [Zea mays]